MKTKQHGGPTFPVHRCFVVYAHPILAVLALTTALVTNTRGRELEDFAQLYVNEFHEPPKSLQLTEENRERSLALAYYSRALSLESKGQFESAVDAYREVLKIQPDRSNLARKTAYLMAQSGKQEEALVLLEDNLANNPDKPVAHIALSEYLATYHSHTEEGRQKALKVIEEAVEKFPDNADVYKHIVRMYLIANRKDDAKSIMDRALERQNPDPHYWLQLGNIAGQVWPVQDTDEPSEPVLLNRIYQKAYERAGADWRVKETVGDFYHATKQFQKAIDVYNDIVETEPDQMEIRQKLARVYSGMGDSKMVIETLKAIVQIDPLDATAHRQLGGIYLREEQPKEAVAHLKKALRISKGGASEYSALARIMIDKDMTDESIDFLKEAAFLFPDSAEFPLLATFPLAQKEDWAASIKQFEVAKGLAEKNTPELLNEQFFFRYAAAVERHGEFDRAAKLFQKSIELIARNDPEGNNKDFAATVYNYLGYMWLENDMNMDEAGELIKTAVDLDPESGAIADSLGWFYFKKGKFEEAKGELLRAEEMVEQPDAVIYDHIGQVFFKLGNFPKAVEYMEKAVELDPDKEEFSKRLEKYRAAAAEKKPEAADNPPEKKE